MQTNPFRIATDPLFAAAVDAVLLEIRDLASYLLASDADLREEFASEQSQQILAEALGALRATAGSVCLDELLKSNRNRRLPATRPGSDLPAMIDATACEELKKLSTPPAQQPADDGPIIIQSSLYHDQ